MPCAEHRRYRAGCRHCQGADRERIRHYVAHVTFVEQPHDVIACLKMLIDERKNRKIIYGADDRQAALADMGRAPSAFYN